MNAKSIALMIFTLVSLYQLFLLFVEYRSADNPTPENVRDVYDAETYAKWKRYHGEKCAHALLAEGVSFVVTFALLATNAYAAVARLFGGNIYCQAIGVVVFDALLGAVIGVALDYRDDMGIEQKYGFNRMTLPTFIADHIKSFLIGMLLTVGLVALLIAIHQWLGDWMAVAFAAALFVVILGISFLAPVLSRVFNKFTPLDDGELKDKLTALLNKNGYQVRAIKVMDASRRSTKSNAYFTGFGRMKTIVLYDTLVASSTPDEICAVFAHEMGHGLHKDTLKNQALSLMNTALLALMVWLTVRTPEIFQPFGFDGVNYGFAYILLGNVEFALISPLLGLLINWHSRRAEYRADAVAAKEGYGEALISSLKNLARENFASLAPSRITVSLSYSHPPLSLRIAAIEAGIKEKKDI